MTTSISEYPSEDERRSTTVQAPARRRTRPAYTLVEIVIGLALFMLISFYFFDTVIFSSKAEQATSKKLIAARTLQYMQGRIRRDLKWARKVKVENIVDQVGGTRLVLENFQGQQRIYDWTPHDPAVPTSGFMKVPKLDGTGSVEYNQTRFRLVRFYMAEHRAEGVRTIMSPLPLDDTEEGASSRHKDRARLWGAACVGRAETIPYSVVHRYGLFNEPVFGPLVEKVKQENGGKVLE